MRGRPTNLLLGIGCCVLLGVASVPAQTAVPYTVPAILRNAQGRRFIPAPFYRPRFFIQTWHNGASLRKPVSFSSFGWRIDQAITTPAQSAEFEVVFDNSTRGFGGLSKTFAQNLGPNATTVFSRRTVQLPPQNRPMDPNRPQLWLPMDRPFTFVGPNFLVQVSTGAQAALGLFCDAYDNVIGRTGLQSGIPCGGILSATYADPNYTLTLTAAGGAFDGAFLLGVDNQALGQVALPLELSGLGMAGCFLGVAPAVTVPFRTNASGFATATLRFTVPPAISEPLHSQAVHVSPLTPAGLATTNMSSVLIGTAGYANYLYNRDRFGPVAEYGPFTTNRRPSVLLLR